MTPDEDDRKPRRKSKPVDPNALDIFAPMHRSSDSAASRMAADRVRPRMNDLRRKVLDVLKKHQPITALEMEELPEFEGFAPTTVRKRCSELVQMGAVEEQGVKMVVLRDGRQTRSTVLVAKKEYKG